MERGRQEVPGKATRQKQSFIRSRPGVKGTVLMGGRGIVIKRQFTWVERIHTRKGLNGPG